MTINKNSVNQLEKSANEIKKLAAMQTCGLQDSLNLSDSEMEKIRLWVRWFDIEANKILEVVDKVKY